MKVLSIGNSFSQDACRYLHQIARADGVNIDVTNLYIGGCSLSHHYRNMMSSRDEYSIEFNGTATSFYTSLKEALLSCDWDVVTLQQVSHESVNYKTFVPYIKELANTIRILCPESKLFLHQTWAYEKGSHRLCEELGYKTVQEMFIDIEKSYNKAYEITKADGLIPSGELFYKLSEKDMKLHRDTFHASLGTGRYALGLLWFYALTGKNIDNNTFSDFDEKIKKDDIMIIKNTVKEVNIRKNPF